MTTSPFDRLKGTPSLISVRMNEEDILLPNSRKAAIGTENLNGCTAIVVFGNAIILSHISPSDPPRNDSRNHHVQALGKIDQLLDEHPGMFPPATTVWGIYGTIDGEAMEHVVAQVDLHFSRRGFGVAKDYYEVAEPTIRQTPAAGQLLVHVNTEGTRVYLENRRIVDKPHPRRAAQSSANTAGASSTGLSTQQIDTQRAVDTQRAQMINEAQNAQNAYQRLLNQGQSQQDAIEALTRSLMAVNPGMKYKDAQTGVYNRLQYRRQ
ncbi:hypothetical protein Slin15195_G037280 [Septoria linicola]|uniref:Uncharacterized protein n=1 Tax=Septoria linicola TaxID=215465 RepID=A0A9Q9ALS6_9PEZI|nr:hypothetical protein Slin14017_G118690 [Septoria linicola]USW50409.1 hypothetical protein Slin15195_G037280 [Septoria linicola]